MYVKNIFHLHGNIFSRKNQRISLYCTYLLRFLARFLIELRVKRFSFDGIKRLISVGRICCTLCRSGVYIFPMRQMIGILGGMGPEATLDLYRHIINLTPASRDQDHFRVLIYSNPKIPDRTLAIAEGGESPLDALLESARLLESTGASIIAMPCNAAHHYLGQLRAAVGIPILDMIAETCGALRKRSPEVKTAGLLASDGTVQSKIYHQALEAEGIRVLLPGESDQSFIQSVIAEVKAGKHTKETREKLLAAGTRLIEGGAQAVILGCTEIPLVFDSRAFPYYNLNSTLILAEAAIRFILSNGD
jgi:aspartate racemase